MADQKLEEIEDSIDPSTKTGRQKHDFQDANEDIEISSDMDVHKAIEETQVALNLFLNNHFSEARNRLEPWADRSPYHALGYGTIFTLQAAMTFEASDIEAASNVVKRSIHVCSKARRKTSVMDNFVGSKTFYDKYTKEELHAELCYAECLIERAMLTFIQDENLINFVKGSLKIRACYQSFKECQKILDKRTWKEDDEKMHFESGVCMGIGAFNLMISLLPSKILKLLEFVGFSGNKKEKTNEPLNLVKKKVGLQMLQRGAMLENSLHGPLCSLAIIGYHTVVTYVIGTADGDIVCAEALLRPCLKKYPKGAMFLFFAGRIQEIRGNISDALNNFEDSIESQTEWRQFHHLCFWELMWCNSFRGDWLLAMKYAERLCKESRWSRATYTYLKASFLLLCDDQTEDTQAHIIYLMEQVPNLKQRIAGKSIPIEKFAVKKAKRYLEQKNMLILPSYEMIYVWNGFSIIGKKKDLIEPVLAKIEETINYIITNKDTLSNYTDDYCLALLLKGVCLIHKGQEFQAEQCFREIHSLEKQLKQDIYLLPYSMMELAMIYMLKKDWTEAKIYLDKARFNYKGYSLESRLHFRVHAANLRIRAETTPDPDDSWDVHSLPDTPSPRDAKKFEAPYMEEDDLDQLAEKLTSKLNTKDVASESATNH